jgi:hypothetical protein
MLDTIHHQGLRLALGDFRTSPVESLYAEAGEPSLHLRLEFHLIAKIQLKILFPNQVILKNLLTIQRKFNH